MSEQTANLCTTDACESLRARLAKYEDAEGRPVVQLSAEAYQQAANCLYVLREIGSMDADDISGDDVDLRFEDGEGRDTGCDVSIVEYAERSAVAIEALFAALESQAREIELVRDALDHIARTCTQSRTHTRRLRWINYRANTALEGKPYDEKLLDLPKNGDQQAIKAELKIKALKAELAALKAQPSGAVLPERKTADDFREYHDESWRTELAEVSNQLIDEVARLNSSPVSLNQCDGCRAGIPAENGMHAMGIPGGYADKMMCTAILYESAPSHGEQVREEWKTGFKLHEVHKALDCGLPLPSYWAETCDGEPYVHTKLWRELPGCGSFHSSRFWPLYGVSKLAATPSAVSQEQGE